eukprot:tig00021617_g22937.t1
MASAASQFGREQDELARQFFAIAAERSGGLKTPQEAHAEHFSYLTSWNGGVEPPELRAARERIWGSGTSTSGSSSEAAPAADAAAAPAAAAHAAPASPQSQR